MNYGFVKVAAAVKQKWQQQPLFMREEATIEKILFKN